MDEDKILREFLKNTVTYHVDEVITEEEYHKRMMFLLSDHRCCSKALNEDGEPMCHIWLFNGGNEIEFWLVLVSKRHGDRFLWIDYCPYCGFKPEKRWW